MTNLITQRGCAATATTDTAGARNHGNVGTKNYTQLECARTVTLTNTTVRKELNWVTKRSPPKMSQRMKNCFPRRLSMSLINDLTAILWFHIFLCFCSWRVLSMMLDIQITWQFSSKIIWNLCPPTFVVKGHLRRSRFRGRTRHIFSELLFFLRQICCFWAFCSTGRQNASSSLDIHRIFSKQTPSFDLASSWSSAFPASPPVFLSCIISIFKDWPSWTSQQPCRSNSVSPPPQVDRGWCGGH